jgi:hypothetical protein
MKVSPRRAEEGEQKNNQKGGSANTHKNDGGNLWGKAQIESAIQNAKTD